MKIERCPCAGVEQVCIYPFDRPRRPESEGGGFKELPYIYVEKFLDGKITINWMGSCDEWDYRERTVENALLFGKAFEIAVEEAGRPIRLNGMMLRPVGFNTIKYKSNYGIVKSPYSWEHLKKFIGWVGKCQNSSVHGASIIFDNGVIKHVPYESLTEL